MTLEQAIAIPLKLGGLSASEIESRGHRVWDLKRGKQFKILPFPKRTRKISQTK